MSISRLFTLVAISLCIINAIALSLEKMQGSFSVLSDLKPLSNISIAFPNLIKRQDNASQLDFHTDITSLSTADISLLSEDAPSTLNLHKFTPFGDTVIFQGHGLLNENEFTSAEEAIAPFKVELNKDIRPIAQGNTKHPSVEVDGTELYITNTNYRATFTTPIGNQYTLLLSMTPISSYANDLENKANANAKPTFESQHFNSLSQSTSNATRSTFHTLSFDSLSGRNTDRFTIEGALLGPNDETIVSRYIAPITTLLFQTTQLETQAQSFLQSQQLQFKSTQLKQTMQQQQEAFASTAHTIQTLQDQILTLQDMQFITSYDLISFTIPISPFSCGSDRLDANFLHVHSNNIDNDAADLFDQQSPNEMSPQFAFPTVKANCHPRQNTFTEIYIRPIVSYSFAEWASGSSVINVNAVISRLKFYFHLAQVPFSQQWGGVYPTIDSILIRLAPTTEAWNPSSPTDTRCANAETLLFKFADFRLNEIQQVPFAASSGHFLFAHCNAIGTIGIAFLNGACHKSLGVSYGSFTSHDPTVLIHELGHNILALPHPFGQNESLMGTYGGILDYTYNYLPNSDPNPRQYGFNMSTDESLGCSGLKALFDRKPTTDYLPSTSCWGSPNIVENTCGNGFREEYEQCDEENECCQECKLAPNASCDGADAECCENCQLKPASTLCTTISKLSGFCFNGQCTELQCARSLPADCSASYIFTPVQSDSCSYTCPKAGSTTCAGAVPSFFLFPHGTYCSVSSGKAGYCLRTADFNSKENYPLRCVPLEDIPVGRGYTWDRNLIQDCTCSLAFPKALIETINCLGPTGNRVADEYCDDSSKPTPTSCLCEATYKWTYGDWTLACGQTECNSGVISRSVECQVCDTILDSCAPADNNLCNLALGMPYIQRPCQYTPSSDQQCGKGNSLSFSCVKNQSFDPNSTKYSQQFYNQCKCQNGWGGTLCRDEPNITNIVASAKNSNDLQPPAAQVQNTSPVFFAGQKILITYDYTGPLTNKLILSFKSSPSAALIDVSTNILPSDGTIELDIGLDTQALSASSFVLSITSSTYSWSSSTFGILNFAWIKSIVGSCYGECGTSLKTDVLSCRRSDSIDVADVYCSTLNKPIASTLCSNDNLDCKGLPTFALSSGHCIANKCIPLDSPLTLDTKCDFGIFGPECNCREAYFTVKFSYAPSALFPDESITDSSNLESSQLTPAQRVASNEWLNIIRAHYAFFSDISIRRIRIAHWRMSKPIDRINYLTLTVGIRSPCITLDPFVLQNLITHSQFINNSPFVLQQTPVRDPKLVASNLDLIYAGMYKIFIALTSNNVSLREKLHRPNAPSTSQLIIEASFDASIFDPKCTFEELNQYDSCFSNLMDPFQDTTTIVPSEENGTSKVLLFDFGALLFKCLCAFVLFFVY